MSGTALLAKKGDVGEVKKKAPRLGSSHPLLLAAFRRLLREDDKGRLKVNDGKELFEPPSGKTTKAERDPVYKACKEMWEGGVDRHDAALLAMEQFFRQGVSGIKNSEIENAIRVLETYLELEKGSWLRQMRAEQALGAARIELETRQRRSAFFENPLKG